jgi:hypothetical protein
MIKRLLGLAAGEYFSPALQVLIYLLFVVGDLFTTFLATPDLGYEANLLIRYFNLTWAQIILFTGCFAILNSILFIYSEKIFSSKGQLISNQFKKSPLTKFLNLRFLLFLFQWTFYSHLAISIFVSINNYLNYIYLYKPFSRIYDFAFEYVLYETFMGPFYFIFLQGSLIFICLFIVYYKVRSKNYYMVAPIFGRG